MGKLVAYFSASGSEAVHQQMNLSPGHRNGSLRSDGPLPFGFYLHQGFELIGFDTCCYTNNDIGRNLFSAIFFDM